MSIRVHHDEFPGWLTDSVLPAPLHHNQWVSRPNEERLRVPLSRHDDGLAHAISSHCGVSILGDGKQMWFELSPSPAAVGLDDFGTIERDALERVDSDEDYSTVGIDTVLGIAVSDGM